MRHCLPRGFIRALITGIMALFAAWPAVAGDQVAEATPRQDMLALTPPKPKPAQAPQVARTRFIIGMDRKAEYQIFSLANPNRVVVEFPDVKFQLPAQSENATVGLVRSSTSK